MLIISKEDFREIYKDLPILKSEKILFSIPKSNEDGKKNYLCSKLWRLNNLYTIVNKFGNRIPFKMNRAQHIVYAEHLRHPRLIILKSRQQGISTLWLVSFFDDACFLDDLSIGLMAQGLDEASSLLARTKILWETLNQEVKDFLKLINISDNSKEFSFSNGSKIFIRTSFRSATLQRLHISEMGKIANDYPKRAKEVKTGSLQTIAPGNVVIIESTGEGDNVFKHMWDTAYLYTGRKTGKDFSPVFLSWLDDPDCTSSILQIIPDVYAKYFDELENQIGKILTIEQKNWWISTQRELKDDVYQEYPATSEEAFFVTREGAYYAKFYIRHVRKNHRIISNLYDRNLPVQVAVDLGMDNYNVLTYFQYYEDAFRIIDEYYNSGEGIAHYVTNMDEKPYNIDHLILPHDAKVRGLNSGITREERFFELGMRNITVLERTSLMDGIELVRKILETLRIDPKCKYLIKCILNYSREWDDKHQIWKQTPLKSQVNNGADSLRYMAIEGARYIPINVGRSRRGGMDV